MGPARPDARPHHRPAPSRAQGETTEPSQLPNTVSAHAWAPRFRRSAIRNSQAPSLLTKRSLVRYLCGEPISSHYESLALLVDS
jgi:hypothetical protein